jgi:hypothetical protein
VSYFWKGSGLRNPICPALVRWHGYRSCCSLLFASGAQVPEAMERMRHADERTTLRIYAKVMRSREAEVDAAFDALIGNKSATNGLPVDKGRAEIAPRMGLGGSSSVGRTLVSKADGERGMPSLLPARVSRGYCVSQDGRTSMRLSSQLRPLKDEVETTRMRAPQPLIKEEAK